VKKLFCYLLGILLLFTYVASYAAMPAQLNKIIYQLHAKSWVKTHKADVVISVNAIMRDQNLPNVQRQIMQKLNQLNAQQKWNVVTFTRSQDQSGLEKLHMVLSARLLESELNNFRDRVKSLSKAGEKFQLQDINFEPSIQDVEQTHNALREKIYKQVKAELQRLNKTFPKQHYFLHDINFSEQPVYRVAENTLIKTSVPAPSAITVKREMTLNAVVVLASEIKS